MRSWLVGTVVGLVLLPSTAAAGRATPSAQLLVGMLTRQAVRECHGMRKPERWVQHHHEVGFVWLRRAQVELKGLEGKLVVIDGQPAARPPLKARGTGDCVVAQMRSDWIPGVKGMRVRRSGQPAIAAFTPRRVRRFKGLTIKAVGRDRFEVRLRNTLGRPLEAVTLRVHYEGCYGKPGSRMQERAFATIPAGATVKARFALSRVDPARPSGRFPRGRRWGRRHHRATTLQVVSRTPSVHLTVDWPLSRVRPPLALECPRRSRRK